MALWKLFAMLLFVVGVAVIPAAQASEAPPARAQVERVLGAELPPASAMDPKVLNEAYWRLRKPFGTYRLAAGLGLVGGTVGGWVALVGAIWGEPELFTVGFVGFVGGAGVLVGSQIATHVALHRMRVLIRYRDGFQHRFDRGSVALLLSIAAIPCLPIYGLGVPMLVGAAILAELQARDFDRAWMSPGTGERAGLELRFTGNALVGRF